MSDCTSSCRHAEGNACRCECEGRGHGAEADTQQLVLWAARTPLEAAVVPVADVVAPEPPEPTRRPSRRPERAEDPGCAALEDGRRCGSPDIAVWNENGRYCGEHADEGVRWRDAVPVAPPPRPVIVRVRAARVAATRGKAGKGSRGRARR